MLWSFILLLILFYSSISSPVRTVVEVKDDSSSHSSSSNKFDYQPVFKKLTKYQQNPEKHRQQLRESRARNPKRYKELNDKYYKERRANPIKRENDKAYSKAYKFTNLEKVRNYQKLYMREYRKKQKEKKAKQTTSAQDNNQKDIRQKGKRKYLQISSDTSDSGTELNVKTRRMQEEISSNKDQQSSSNTNRPHIVARLKLPPKTIKEFFGTRPPAD